MERYNFHSLKTDFKHSTALLRKKRQKENLNVLGRLFNQNPAPLMRFKAKSVQMLNQQTLEDLRKRKQELEIELIASQQRLADEEEEGAQLDQLKVEVADKFELLRQMAVDRTTEMTNDLAKAREYSQEIQKQCLDLDEQIEEEKQRLRSLREDSRVAEENMLKADQQLKKSYQELFGRENASFDMYDALNEAEQLLARREAEVMASTERSNLLRQKVESLERQKTEEQESFKHFEEITAYIEKIKEIKLDTNDLVQLEDQISSLDDRKQKARRTCIQIAVDMGLVQASENHQTASDEEQDRLWQKVSELNVDQIAEQQERMIEQVKQQQSLAREKIQSYEGQILKLTNDQQSKKQLMEDRLLQMRQQVNDNEQCLTEMRHRAECQDREHNEMIESKKVEATQLESELEREQDQLSQLEAELAELKSKSLLLEQRLQKKRADRQKRNSDLTRLLEDDSQFEIDLPKLLNQQEKSLSQIEQVEQNLTKLLAEIMNKVEQSQQAEKKAQEEMALKSSSASSLVPVETVMSKKRNLNSLSVDNETSSSIITAAAASTVPTSTASTVISSSAINLVNPIVTTFAASNTKSTATSVITTTSSSSSSSAASGSMGTRLKRAKSVREPISTNSSASPSSLTRSTSVRRLTGKELLLENYKKMAEKLPFKLPITTATASSSSSSTPMSTIEHTRLIKKKLFGSSDSD